MDEELSKEQEEDAQLRKAIIADINPDAAADDQEWYLPVAGLDQARYPSSAQARIASIRLCAIRGVPFVDPLSTDEPFRD